MKVAKYRVSLPRHSTTRDCASLRGALILCRSEVRDGWRDSVVLRLSDGAVMALAVHGPRGTYRVMRTGTR